MIDLNSIKPFEDYTTTFDSAFTSTTWCIWCYGTGLRRIAHSNSPRVEIKTCSRCKGRKKIWVKEGSELHKAGEKIVPGLYPGIRKTKS